jgi:5'(3')-deoxyribonucleotidase
MTEAEIALLQNILAALQDINIRDMKADVDEHCRILKGVNGTPGMVANVAAMQKSVQSLVKMSWGLVIVLALTHLDQIPKLVEWVVASLAK